MDAVDLSPAAQRFGSDAGWSVERNDGKFVRFTPLSHFDVHFYEYNHTVNIDRWGGRVVNGQTERADPVVVPFLGDSFMFGIGVEDQQTFVSLLNSQTSTQYLNLGVPGSALPQHLDMLDFRFHELHDPRICVFSFFTGNDYTDIVKYYTQTQKPNESDGDSRLAATMEFLLHRFHILGRSYLFEFCKQLLTNAGTNENEKRKIWGIRSPNGRRMSSVPLLLMSKKRPFQKEAETYLDMALDRLEDVSKRDHFTPIFIIIPDKHQINMDLLQEKANLYGLDLNDYDRRLPDKIIDEDLRRRHIEYFDLFDCLNGKDGMYYKIDDHFTPQGAHLVAGCLSDLNARISALESSR